MLITYNMIKTSISVKKLKADLASRHFALITAAIKLHELHKFV